MNEINNRILLDLEIYEKVLPILDKTITVFGNLKLKEIIKTVYYDFDKLSERRNILLSMLKFNKNIKKIKKNLEQIKYVQNDINWLFQDNEKEIEEFCFKYDYLNISELISTKNFYKIYSPSFLIIIYILIYLVLKFNKLEIDITSYLLEIYRGYQTFMFSILTLFVDNFNLLTFLANFFANIYVLYQFYAIYNSCDSSYTHFNKCKIMKEKIKNINILISCTENILKNDKFLLKEKKIVHDKLKYIKKIFDKAHTIGGIVLTKQQKKIYEDDFDIILQYIGSLDCFISIISLVKNNNFKFPEYNFNNPKPFIVANGLFLPYFHKEEQVKNDCYLGDPSIMIITGPNSCGKSTYIRNVMLSILFAQTIGVTCCDNLIFTPFYSLFTYLDIPNVARYKESLFEAEINYCSEYCNILENLKPNLFSFTIMDELFTGTNPREGISASSAVCEYSSKFDNNLLIVTTHFHELTKLENSHPGKFINMKFSINKENDKFIRNYQIEKGISNQNIAIELLKQKGYNSYIIKRAIEKSKEINI